MRLEECGARHNRSALVFFGEVFVLVWIAGPGVVVRADGPQPLALSVPHYCGASLLGAFFLRSPYGVAQMCPDSKLVGFKASDEKPLFRQRACLGRGQRASTTDSPQPLYLTKAASFLGAAGW